MHADKITVSDDGELAGLGTHEELLKNCEVYQEIYYSQYPEERPTEADRATSTSVLEGGAANV